MCGRFQASSSPAELARWFKTTGRVPNLQQRYNAAPGQRPPIVLRDPENGERRLEALLWGLVPFWAKDAKIGYLKINAMADTVASQPAFRDAFKRRRCLVPADGFYEWKPLRASSSTGSERHSGRPSCALPIALRKIGGPAASLLSNRRVFSSASFRANTPNDPGSGDLNERSVACTHELDLQARKATRAMCRRVSVLKGSRGTPNMRLLMFRVFGIPPSP
jgi:hypothetical protein